MLKTKKIIKIINLQINPIKINKNKESLIHIIPSNKNVLLTLKLILILTYL